MARPEDESSTAAGARGEGRARRRRFAFAAVKVVFGLLGLAFIGLELAHSWHQATRLADSWPRLIAAIVIALVVVACSARAWAALLGRHGSVAVHRGFYLSQFGKYVPGGVWQAAGQVGFARDEGIGIGEASAAFTVYALVQVIAGAGVGALFAALSPGLRAVPRVLLVAGALLTLLLHRGWMRRAVELIARILPRLHAGLLPRQRDIVASYLWTAASLMLGGLLFAVLLEPGGAEWWAAALAAFVTGWWVGFIALPFPSGIGVREAILVGLLAPHVSTGSILVAAIGQRLVAIAAEIAMVAQTTLRVRSGARRDRDQIRDVSGS